MQLHCWTAQAIQALHTMFSSLACTVCERHWKPSDYSLGVHLVHKQKECVWPMVLSQPRRGTWICAGEVKQHTTTKGSL